MPKHWDLTDIRYSSKGIRLLPVIEANSKTNSSSKMLGPVPFPQASDKELYFSFCEPNNNVIPRKGIFFLVWLT